MGTTPGRAGAFLPLLTVAVLLAGCTSSGAPSPTSSPTSSPTASPTSSPSGGTSSPTSSPTGGPASPTSSTSWPSIPTSPPGGRPADDGGVPAGVLSAMVADLAGRLGVAESAIEVLQAQAVTWNDGSIGCPKPGMSYTQALVDGYWVILGFDGVLYDYHASRSGYFFLCE